jgi:hypothetical protein
MDAPPEEYVPSGQVVQNNDAVLIAKVPGWQVLQKDLPLLE